jgi:large subunit ribosomal protein L29
MAKKEKINYGELSVDELRQRLGETREALFQMRFHSATAALKNPHALTAARRDIARTLTTLKQKGSAL